MQMLYCRYAKLCIVFLSLGGIVRTYGNVDGAEIAPVSAQPIQVKESEWRAHSFVIPEFHMPDQARMAQCQRIIACQQQDNVRHRGVIRGVAAGCFMYMLYSFCGAAKDVLVGWFSSPVQKNGQEAVLDQETQDMLCALVHKSLWKRGLEVMGYSALGFFITKQLNRLSDLLATHVFYPVTTQWFIEQKHPVLVTSGKDELSDEVSQYALNQKNTDTRSPYLEEIERFVQACTDVNALSREAHDNNTYCVVTALNSFIAQMEWIIAFIAYQEQHVAPLLAEEIAATRIALLQTLEQFCIHVRMALYETPLTLQERKGVLCAQLEEMRAGMRRLIVDRLYRLESYV